MLIYVVEDDDDIRSLEVYALQSSGNTAYGFSCGAQFFDACRKEIPSLVILDVMLPTEDGISILKKLRADERTRDILVMMVTAKTSELDKVRGLDCGADDYVAKPFGVLELVARTKALLRRLPTEVAGEILQCGNITMDEQRHIVTNDAAICELTYKEYELLKLLLINKTIALSRETIMNRVWGYDFAGESRTVDVHIKTLRQKLEGGGNMIKTVRNVGYKMEEAR